MEEYFMLGLRERTDVHVSGTDLSSHPRSLSDVWAILHRIDLLCGVCRWFLEI